MKSGSILDEIIAKKAARLTRKKQTQSPSQLAQQAEQVSRPPLSLAAALRAAPGMGLLAEVKKASPSKGLIRPDFKPLAIAQAYMQGGVQGISVLTEEDYFQGSDAFLQQIREISPLPLLRKDFIFDPYQIDEARVMGADAILLIAAVLDGRELAALRDHARRRKLEVLLEVHNQEELDRALAMKDPPEMVGINNRDLHTFAEELATTERLINQLPTSVCRLSESAIRSHDDWLRAQAAGADAVLVGELLMRQGDIPAAVAALRG